MTDDTTPADHEDAAQDAEVLKLEVEALKEQVLRYAAEAENTKRRAEREANDARAYAIQRFANDLLGVADNLARAGRRRRSGGEEPRRRPGDDREGSLGRLRAQWAQARRSATRRQVRPAPAPGGDGADRGRCGPRGGARGPAGRLRSLWPHRPPGDGGGFGQGLDGGRAGRAGRRQSVRPRRRRRRRRRDRRKGLTLAPAARRDAVQGEVGEQPRPAVRRVGGVVAWPVVGVEAVPGVLVDD